MVNILLLGGIYSDDREATFLKNSRRGYQSAAQNLQKALVDGFIQNGIDLTVASVPFLSTFPIGYKKPFVETGEYIYKGLRIGKSFGFLNLPLLNHPCHRRIDRYVDKWYQTYSGDKTIFVYALLRWQMECAVRAKQRHPDIKISIIIPDLPMYMNCNRVYKALRLQLRDMSAINGLVHVFDSYVVLAKPMTDALKISNKPSIVVEGILNALQNGSEEVAKLPGKTIMYAGGIQTRYGVFDLIEAFQRLQGEDYRLLLCGGCGEMEKLNRCLAKDSRISYLGLLPTEKVRELQRQVTLLVNPRHSAEEFTKYSFPSKTLEYMASGTPVLMSPLPSMPEEYKEHLYLFDDESVVGMSKAMADILAKDGSELSAKGVGAKAFIIERKNPKAQVEKIISLFNS